VPDFQLQSIHIATQASWAVVQDSIRFFPDLGWAPIAYSKGRRLAPNPGDCGPGCPLTWYGYELLRLAERISETIYMVSYAELTTSNVTRMCDQLRFNLPAELTFIT